MTMILADISKMAGLTFPIINTMLLVCLTALVLWHFRSLDIEKIREEIEALKFRVDTQAKLSPCAHCRDHYSAVTPVEDECDC